MWYTKLFQQINADNEPQPQLAANEKKAPNLPHSKKKKNDKLAAKDTINVPQIRTVLGFFPHQIWHRRVII